MNLKKILFVAILGIVTFPAVVSAKPVPGRHTVKPAMKAHFAKLRFTQRGF
jgi:hypothetical protein